MAQLIGSGANQVPVNGMLGTAAFVDKEQLPVSDPQQVALNLKANLASPALTGTPTAPTAAVGTDTTQLATTAFVNAEIANDAPTKTGGGASGTWGISVTGNAATTTKLKTPVSINGVAFDGTSAVLSSDWVNSQRDFVNGTLVTTSIDYSQAEGDPWLLEIRGNSYSQAVPFDISVQGYIYSNTIIEIGGISNGSAISGIVALNVGGFLCFWWPRQAYWHGFSVRCLSVKLGGVPNRNLVVSIDDVAKPASNKEVAFNPFIRQSLHSGNYNTYSPTLTGGGASGTWPINITGNAAASNGATARWYSAQINGTAAQDDSSAAVEVRNVNGASGDGGMASIAFHCQGAYAIKMGLRPDGYFILGGWSRPAYSWYSDPSGNMVAAGNVSAYSDPRLKENFKRVEKPLEILQKLDGGTFNWRVGIPHTAVKEGKLDYGILADQVEAVMPEIVTNSIEIDEVSYKTVAYEKLVPVLIEAIKELNTRLKELEAK